MKIAPLTDYLLTRRSVKAAQLNLPSPNKDEIRQMLTAAMRVPDHGKLAPWKVVVFEKAGQEKLGELFAARFHALNPDAKEKHLEHERMRAQRAPLLIAVVFVPQIGKIPVWEQELATGALCMNLLHAAYGLGYAGQWLTEWPAFDEEITHALCPQEGAKIAGFFYIGSSDSVPEDRKRPEFDEIVSEWD